MPFYVDIAEKDTSTSIGAISQVVTASQTTVHKNLSSKFDGDRFRKTCDLLQMALEQHRRNPTFVSNVL